jgi:hypothetical protein
MRRGIYLLLLFGLWAGCSDTFNLPEYGSDIEDNEDPIITVVSPEENFTYNGLTQIPVNLTVTDNFELEAVQLQLNPSNVVGDGISFTRTVNDSIFSIDTVYTFPAGDSIVFDVLVVANDVVNNTAFKSFSFTAVK